MKREAEEENPEDYVDPETPLGEKKKLSRQMAKTFSPSAVENSYAMKFVIKFPYYLSLSFNPCLNFLLGGMNGGKSLISSRQTQKAPNHLLSL